MASPLRITLFMRRTVSSQLVTTQSSSSIRSPLSQCLNNRTGTPRMISTTRPLQSGGPPSYDPPTGNLFGVPPGEKYQNEGWEGWWVYGFWGGLGVAGVAYCFKPDTSIQTWALEEARRRLEAEGILGAEDGRTTE